MARFAFRAAAVFGLLAGCSRTTDFGPLLSTSAGTTSATAQTGTAGAGPGGASSGTVAIGSGGTGSGSNGTGGTTTGPAHVVDGGYVFCTAPGGGTSWLCPPGTYFCDLGDARGNCFQCRFDSDCADPSLPTFNPTRPRCDVSSGVTGYQGFCQQCLDILDCVGNLAGSECDLSASFTAPPIMNVGFETCGPLPMACPPGSYPVDGLCVALDAAPCSTDLDCAGVVSASQLPEPFCASGSCSVCDAGACPWNRCADGCGDAGLTCDPQTGRCLCSDSSQCGGNWPVCEVIDFQHANDAGQFLGTCGCDQSEQCGDAGLSCLPSLLNQSVCGLSCADPRLPACVLLNSGTPDCNTFSGYCTACTNDENCQDLGSQPLVGSYCQLYGECGCRAPTDCPRGALCQNGQCNAPLPRCDPVSCQSEFCDWDSGACWQPDPFEPLYAFECLTDYDCSYSPGSAGPFCTPDGGVCVQCLDDSDCVRLGLAATGKAHCDPVRLACTTECGGNADCAESPLGPVCIDGGDAPDSGNFCGCGSDLDCVGSTDGEHCDVTLGDSLLGSCVCRQSSECPAGEACPALRTGAPSQCSAACASDADCPTSTFCDPASTCRPRCDTGHSCQAPDSVCDSTDVARQNGKGISGSVPAAQWCYSCLHGSDCPAGLGCGADTRYSCSGCGPSSDCRPGEVCLVDGNGTQGTVLLTNGVCHPGCAAESCPAGEICDSQGVAGNGRNVCYECLGPYDCPDGMGCDSLSHRCGTCWGPSVDGGPFDCPPNAICSNYWTPRAPGVCLQNCDVTACPTGERCATLPALTPDHKYCFGCLRDEDCASNGPGAWCDVSVNLTFTCQVPADPP